MLPACGAGRETIGVVAGCAGSCPRISLEGRRGRRRRGVGVPDPGPIFVVGLPRSGSTLIEQILASHSQVEGTHELAGLQRIYLK
jgi:hypothetical protein